MGGKMSLDWIRLELYTNDSVLDYIDIQHRIAYCFKHDAILAVTFTRHNTSTTDQTSCKVV